MRWLTSCVVVTLLIVGTTADWSWGGDKGDATESQPKDKSELLEGEELPAPEAQKKSFENATVLDDIVDELFSQKQGRSLSGFNDEVYSDPTIKEALDAGDDLEARNQIKSRLCTLGLIECEGDEPEEKRYLSPDELIYAQPVDIKPVGKPVASIPVRGPPRAYGPAKPMPYPPRPYKGSPPKRIGYGSSTYPGSRPGFSEKYGSNFQFSQGNSLYGNQDSNYVTRPPSYANNSPYIFENSKPTYNKVPQVPSQHIGTKPESVVQQHVHHHYVHSDDNKDPKVIIKPVAIPVGSVGHLGSQGLIQPTTDVITAAGGDYSGFNGGFKPMTAGYNIDNPDTIYGSQYQHTESANFLSQHLPKPYPSNSFDDNKYGNSLSGSYGSQNSQFYKKELNVGGAANNLFNQGPASFGQNAYQENYHEAKAQGFECVCVNYDQCPNEEIIGRRDDLYLPIDPRNKGGNVEALTEDQLDNLNKTETAEAKTEKIETVTKAEVKKVSKRETKEENSDEGTSKDIEPRLIGLAGYGGYGGNGNKKVQPTFGVSFGLPQPSHGGYPINPYNDPIHNPYGPAINGGGINLGLISVNPLVSLQVTKNDYGEKVVKPFVNLHVTPNEHVVHKLGHLFNEKKHYLLHEHYHHYKPPYHHGHYHYGKPIVHHPHPPPFVHPHPPPFAHPHPPHFAHPHPPLPPPPHFPPHYGPPPVYSPHFQHYEPGHFKVHPYNAQETPQGNDDDYYDDDESGNQHNQNLEHENHFDDHAHLTNNLGGFHNPDLGFDRSANVSGNNRQGYGYANRFQYSRSLTLPKPNHGANRGGQTVRFPSNRKKRDIEKPVTETIEEERQYVVGGRPQVQQCRQNQVCCRRPLRPQAGNRGQCGIRHSQGINGRIKTPSYVDGDAEFGEYPWQAAILKKDPKESVYVCGGTLIDSLHIMTAAHCIKTHKAFELRVRLGEWDVNHDVEFFPYIERDVVSVHVHPLYYAGTLDNDLAILKLEHPVEWNKYPHISPACLPDKYTDYAGQRCWTTGWGKDAFGDYGKYQNILKEVDVPVLAHGQCQQQLRQTRLGYNYELNPGFLCAGGEDGKDACKGDGGGPLVCERGGTWQLVGVVSWGIGCGQPGVPGVYVKVAHYLDWISQITGKFSPY